MSLLDATREPSGSDPVMARLEARRWSGQTWRLALNPDLVALVLVLLIGGLLRAAFLLRATVFIIPDSENYFLPGFQLARGLGFDLEPRRAPIYPVFIAAVVSGLGQDLASLALAQHVLGLLSAGLTYWLGRLTFGRLAGSFAGLLVGLNGSLLIAEQTVSTETLFTSWIALAALLWLAAVRRMQRPDGGTESASHWPRTSWLLLSSGALLGLGALTRPVGLALLPAVPLALAVVRLGWRRWLGLSALYVVGASLVLLPWMVRNFLTLRVFSTEGAFGQTLVGRTVRHDRFVFVDPRGAPDPDPGRQRARELMQEAANRRSFITPLRRRMMAELGLTELEANRLMRDLAIEAILRQPAHYVLGTGRSLVTLALGSADPVREAWQSRRDPEAREEWESHREVAGLLGPPGAVQEQQLGQAEQLAQLWQPARYGPVLLALFGLGIVAAAVGGAQYRPASLLGFWAITLLLVGVAFVGPVLRYRYPAEPFLTVLQAGGLVALIGWVHSASARVSSLWARSPGSGATA